MGKKAVYFCAISVLLPAIIQNYRRLSKGDRQKWNQVIKKYIRSVLHLTALASLPAILWCVESRISGQFNRVGSVACFFVGITLSYLFEPVGRHQTYMGFMFPKAVQLLCNLLEYRGYIKQTNLKALVTFVLLCGHYGLI